MSDCHFLSLFKILLSFFVIIILFACEQKGIIKDGAELEKIADGFAFTEGPAADGAGNVFFTDQPNDRIYCFSTDGNLSVFCEGCGRANGLFFDHDGNLLSCSDMNNELWSINADGSHIVLVSNFGGNLLNGPNDLWVSPSGGIYFTDPLYPRSYWTRSPDMQQPSQRVYFLASDRKTITVAADSLVQPNGIIGTADGRLLYVADIGDNKTYVYDIMSDGSLTNRKLFTNKGSDGMTIDSRGNIYLTGHGVSVFNPQGEQIEHIHVEEPWTANVCFGGKENKTLFITASEGLYRIEMIVSGK